MKRLTAVATAAAVLLALSAPAFAAAKPDLDGLLKQIFHGKPGWWTTDLVLPAPAKGHALKLFADFPLFWPHKADTK